MVILSIFMSVASYAQADRPFRQLATQKVNQQLREQNPEIIKEQASIERYLQSFKQVGQVKPRVIPIVFHVIYSSDRERISEQQIYSQLEALNRDFNHQVKTINHPAERLEGFADKKPERIDITFCLAEVTIGDSKSTGVEYLATDVRTWQADQQIKSKKTGGADAYQPDKYLNVWVGAFDDAVSGFAQMPGGPSETDGIVIDYRFFGIGGSAVAPYDQGKTLTHLVGNYLGLYDLWNETVPCSDDGVKDTPIHNAPNVRCPDYRHLTLCSEKTVAMTMNFMDNTDDACMNMFTFGQMIRMHAVLGAKGPRKKLSSGASKCQVEQTIAGRVIDSRSKNNQDNFFAASPDLQIRPNPANEQMDIQVSRYQGTVNLVIYNSVGQIVIQKRYANEIQQINTSQWENGIYFVHVQLEGKKITNKLAVTH